MICPARLRMGAASETSPFLQFLIVLRPAARADVGNQRLQLVDVGHGAARARFQRGVAQHAVERVVIEPRQQHAPHRRAIGRQPAADGQVDRHDLACRHAQHVDDLGAVEHGDRAAFMHRLRERLHDRLGQVPERHRGQVGEAEIEDLGREPELAAIGLHIAQPHQREQDTPRAGPREAAGLGDLGQRLGGVAGVERADHGQPACEGLHIAVARLLGGRCARRAG